MIQVNVIVNVQSHETGQYLVTLLTDMCSASHMIECSRNHFYRPQSLRRLCFYTCLSFCPWGAGGWWYPSMPCRSPGGYPIMPCRFPGPHPRGSLRGLAKGGSPGPHPGGSPGPQGGVSQHALRQTPPPPQLMATTVGGTHPTGMHSCVCCMYYHMLNST